MKEIIDDITNALGTYFLAFMISVLLVFVFWQLLVRMYYMSTGSPSATELKSNSNMIFGGIIALLVITSIAGIMAFANDVLTGIIKK